MVTNALNIASELAVRANIELVVCGGSLRTESYELVGPLAELTLSNINLDIAIVVSGDGDIATVALNNPGKFNALTIAMLRDLASIVPEFSAVHDLRCIVWLGVGSDSFAAGAYIHEIMYERVPRTRAKTSPREECHDV